MIYETIIRRTPIDKGWSGDQKYCAVSDDGAKYLLRISTPDRYDRRKQEYARMKECEALGITMPKAVEFGVLEEGVYILTTWIDGEDAGDALKNMDGQTQYQYGVEAGRILKKLHTLPAPDHAPDWEPRFNAKIDRKIAMYNDCPMKYAKGDLLLNYLAENRHLLVNRPQTYQHGDYHTGNMMIGGDGKLYVIDFDRDDFGDPWEEFNRIVWSAQDAPEMARGMVDGYFDGTVPELFWRLLLLYISSNTLGSLPWAVPYGMKQVKVMTDQWADIRRWYDDFRRIVPSWYRKEE